MEDLEDSSEITIEPIEISDGNMMYIGTKLSTEERKKIWNMLQ